MEECKSMTRIPAGTAKADIGPPDDALGQYKAELLSDTGGLTQFGTFVEELAPGAASSYDHWHASEDEMVYILEGEVTLRENGKEHLLRPGDAACWPAGDDTAHCLRNLSPEPVRYLVIGTRLPQDRVTYPDLKRVLHYDRTTDTRRYTDLSGNPAEKPF